MIIAKKIRNITLLIICLMAVLIILSSTVFAEEIDNTAPMAGIITINNDDAEAESINVALTISASDNIAVTEMMISNDSGFTGVSYEPYEETRAWVLPREDGEKTVYIKFRDATGNESEVSNDKITLKEKIAQSGDVFVTCDINGLQTGTFFSTATVTVTDIDDTGNYEYYGVDIGIFKKPDTCDPDDPFGVEWPFISEDFKNTIVTNSTIIKVDNFGNITDYEFDKVYAIGYRVLYKPISEEEEQIIEGPWKMVTDSYFKPYQQLQGITFNPNGGIYAGDVKVAVSCSDTDGVQTSKWIWSDNSSKPLATEAWTTFTTFAAADKAEEGTWYLHVESTDKLGNIIYAKRKYIIISKTAVTVRAEDGKIALAGKEGDFKLLSKQGYILNNTTWGNGTSNIYTALSYSNGNILLAGQNGKYRIRDSSGNWITPSGSMWLASENGDQYSIKSLAHLYNESGSFTDEIIMLGNQGHWQVINKIGTLSSTKKGDSDLGDGAAVGRQDGYIVMAGTDGKVKMIKPDGKTLFKQEKWTKDGGNKLFQDSVPDQKHIYAVLALPDKSILFAGEEGKIQRRTFSGYWQNSMTWGPGEEGITQDITTLSLLPNGNVLMVGRDGYFHVLKKSNNYTVLGTSEEEKGNYMSEALTLIQSAFPREDGRVVIAGSNSNIKLYKLEANSDISLDQAGDKFLVLNTTWDNEGLMDTNIEISSNGGSTWTDAAVTWDTNNTKATVTGLEPLSTYHLRVVCNTPLSYPIYFKPRVIIATTANSVKINKFTDRVTGANAWLETNTTLTEAQKIELNRYYPDYEVVCKIEIDPKNADVDSYKIKLDVNKDDTTGMSIDSIKVVRIDYDTDTKWKGENPDVVGGADKPLGSNTSTDTIEFQIDHLDNSPQHKPNKKVVTVYLKYKFKNTGAIPDQFKNKVTVIPIINGVEKKAIEDEIIIRLRKARGQYM